MLERLVLRPELAAFEQLIQDRVERVAALEDERIARPRTLERDEDGLAVVSEFVPGSRLSDLLEASTDTGIVPGIDAALGYLLDILPALCGLHAGAGFAHGAIAPSRTVLTPAGQVVLLDAVYGGVLAHLRFSRRTLWVDFGIATPPSAGAPQLRPDADVTQVVLSATMIVLGRPLRTEEYPGLLPALVQEVVEAASIRMNAAFGAGVHELLQRGLPLPGGGQYASADDVLIHVRDLAATIGIAECRRALVDFIQQMDSWAGTRPASAAAPLPDALGLLESGGLDELTAAAFEVLDDTDDGQDGIPFEEDDDDEPAQEIALDDLVDAGDAAAGPITTIDVLPEASPLDDPALLGLPAQASGLAEADAGTSSVRSRRAKRTRSPRARKDTLRSAAAPPPPAAVPTAAPMSAPAPAPEPLIAPPPPARAGAGWLVRPDRAAAFDPPVDPVAPAPPQSPAHLPPPLPAPVVGPAVAGAAGPLHDVRPQPFQVPAAPPVPPVLTPVPASAAAMPSPPPAIPAPPADAPSAPIKLKATGRKAARVDHAPAAVDIYAPPPPPQQPHGGSLPWKPVAGIAAAAVLAGGLWWLSPGTDRRPAATAAPVAAESAAPPPAATTLPGTGAAVGRLEIETQPAGARVLVDGKAAGESPLALDGVPAGRHTITIVAPSGTVTRTVRIEAGRTLKLDVPVFSGWVGIFAPFVLEVAEGGRVIGTTDEPRLMLSPGRHTLTLSNRDLAYRSVHTVEIEPGEVRSLTVDPRGTVNLNATPWAEVWFQGRKIGDTPLANYEMPLGIQDVTFRHPDLGERKVTVTVKGDAPVALSVDFTAP